VCIGQHFAGLEIKTTLHQMLRRYRWSVPDRYSLPYERLPIGRPRDGLKLRIERL
jgi:cytochrome P450